MPVFEPIKPGDGLSAIKAPTYNGLIESAKAYNRDRLNTGFDPKVRIRQAGCVQIFNAGGDVNAFVPMWTCDVVRPGEIDSTLNHLFEDQNTLDFAGTPGKDGLLFFANSVAASDKSKRQLIVPIEPIASGRIGWGVASGVVPCYVHCQPFEDDHEKLVADHSDGVHNLFAVYDPVTQAGSPPALKAAHSGQVQILSPISSSMLGSTHLLMIRISNDEQRELERFTLYDDLGEEFGAGSAEAGRGTGEETSRVRIFAAPGWTGYAVGVDPDDDEDPLAGFQGDSVYGYFDRESGSYWAVGAGEFILIGTYHEDGADYIRASWRSGWPVKDFPIDFIDEEYQPEEGDDLIAFHTKFGWRAMALTSFKAGCGIEIDEETGRISVKLSDFVDDGLEWVAGEGEECDKLKVKADCGIIVTADGVGVQRADLIATNGGLEAGGGTCDLKVKVGCGLDLGESGVFVNRDDLIAEDGGLEAGEGSCDLKVKVGCGLVLGAGGVEVDNTQLAGVGITAGEGCTLDVLLVGLCGINAAGNTIAINRTEMISPDGGLEAGEGDCDLKVKVGCGLDVGEGGVFVQRDDLIAADGGLEAGSGTCDLKIKFGCGIVVDADGVKVYRPELIATDGGLEAGGGTCDLKVKAGCHIQVTAAGVSVDLATVAPSEKNPGLQVFASENPAEPCSWLAVKPDCGIQVTADGVGVKRDELIAADGGLEAGGGTCDVKVKADCGIEVGAGGVKVKRGDLIQANGGLEAGSGTCDLRVKVDCGLQLGAGGVSVKRSDLIQANGGLAAGSGTCDLKVELGCGLEISSGAVRVKRGDLIQASGGLATGSGACDLKVDLSSSSPLWSGANNSYVVVSDVSWNAGTCVMTKTTKTLTIPNNIPTTFT